MKYFKKNQTKEEEMKVYDSIIEKSRFDTYSEKGYDFVFEKTVGRLNNGYLLDVGCGSCAFGIRLAKKGFTVIGIDLSRNALLSAREWAEEEGVNLNLIVADVENMPFKNHIFDVCFCGQILHHLPKLNRISKEISRVTKIHSFMFAVELNALNPFVWVTFNVIHRIINLSWIPTSNQRALFPKEIKEEFEKEGFEHFEFIAANIELNPTKQKEKSAFSRMKAKIPFITEKFLPKLCRGKMLIIRSKR